VIGGQVKRAALHNGTIFDPPVVQQHAVHRVGAAILRLHNVGALVTSLLNLGQRGDFKVALLPNFKACRDSIGNFVLFHVHCCADCFRMEKKALLDLSDFYPYTI